MPKEYKTKQTTWHETNEKVKLEECSHLLDKIGDSIIVCISEEMCDPINVTGVLFQMVHHSSAIAFKLFTRSDSTESNLSKSLTAEYEITII